jgi:hypothetical protein
MITNKIENQWNKIENSQTDLHIYSHDFLMKVKGKIQYGKDISVKDTITTG